MKHALAALVLIFTPLHAAEPRESFPQFMNLGKREAAAAARKQAEKDFAEGRYRILAYGLTAAMEDKRLARQGIEKKPIAGCVVTDGIIEGARVYNETMRAKLKARLGRDIFDEAGEPKSQQ